MNCLICRETRPVFLELQAWPTLNFDGDPGSCPFDLKRREKKEVFINKEIKENREKYFNPNTSKVKTQMLESVYILLRFVALNKKKIE